MGILGIVMSIALAQLPPPAPVATGSVEGRVVRAGSEESVAEVTVELILERTAAGAPPQAAPSGARPNGGRFLAVTETDGRFTIGNVPPGDYRLYATHPNGYLPSEHSQRSATGVGAPLTLAAGQKLADVTLKMTPTASISGRIVDGDGDPVVFASILAFRIAYRADGERKVEIAQSVLTDDRGEFRMFWLAPGRYYLSAMPIETRQYGLPLMYAARFGGAQYLATPMLGYRSSESGEIFEETWVPIYYPGTTDVRTARQIDLSPGAHFNANLSVAASPTRTLQIQGTALDPAGKPLGGAEVRLTLKKTDGHSVVLPTARSDDTGAFTLRGVVPGSYLMFVTGQMVLDAPVGRVLQRGDFGGTGTTATAAFPIDIGNTNVSGLKIPTVPAVNIPWRVAFESPSDANAKAAIDVQLIREPPIALDGLMGRGAFNDFPLEGNNAPKVLQAVAVGDYRVKVNNLPPNAYIKSIRMGGVDVLRDGLHIAGAAPDPLEIVIAANGGVINGVARDPIDRPLANASVVLLPEIGLRQNRMDLFKTTASGANGAFRLEGVAPGDYRLFVWEDVREGDWYDPEFMKDYELRGASVHVAGSEPVEVTAPAIPAERSAQ